MKVFLAAAETLTERMAALTAEKAPNVLTSYFYADTIFDGPVVAKGGAYGGENKRRAWLHMMRQANLRLIDSGAFTLRTSVLSLVSTSGSASATSVDYDGYLHSYIAWLKHATRLGLADYWVELDIGAVTSHDWVDRHRRLLISAGLGGGLVQVWHSDQDWDYWLYLLREARQHGRSGYVAIEGHQLNRDPLNYTRFLKAAYDRGVRVHGFRMTDEAALQRWPFFSVDSSSWAAITSFGHHQCVTRTGGIRSVPPDRKLGSGALRRAWVGATSTDVFHSAHRLDALRASARAWIKSGAVLDEMWKRRGVDWDNAIKNPVEAT